MKYTVNADKTIRTTTTEHGTYTITKRATGSYGTTFTDHDGVVTGLGFTRRSDGSLMPQNSLSEAKHYADLHAARI